MSEKLTYSQVIDVEGQPSFLNRESGKRADLHLHTSYSDGSVSPEEMVELGLLAGMNAIAITDHDIIESSDRAMNYVSRNRLPIEVVRGMEVSSRDGHVLALDIEGFIPHDLPLTETIKMIHRQRGFAIIPHPPKGYPQYLYLYFMTLSILATMNYIWMELRFLTQLPK